MKKRRLPFLFVLLTLSCGLMMSFTQVAYAQTSTTLTSSSCITPGSTHVMTGTLPPDGASYIISVPSNWNGTLALYSHGYVFPGQSNPAKDAGDPPCAHVLDGVHGIVLLAKVTLRGLG